MGKTVKKFDKARQVKQSRQMPSSLPENLGPVGAPAVALWNSDATRGDQDVNILLSIFPHLARRGRRAPDSRGFSRADTRGGECPHSQ